MSSKFRIKNIPTLVTVLTAIFFLSPLVYWTIKENIFYLNLDLLRFLFEQYNVILLLLIILTISIKSMQYLNNDKKTNNNINNITEEKIEELKNNLEVKIEQQIDQKLNQNKITEEDRLTLLNELKLKIENETNEAYLKELKEKIIIQNSHDGINSLMEVTLSRINSEIHSLVRRSNFNLVIGMSLSMLGIMALFSSLLLDNTFFMFFESNFKIDPPPKNLEELLIRILPKAMFVIMVELFSYFFLNLYKKSLNEIKYYQNELTNVESKLLALKCAKQINNHKLMSIIIEELVKTERNFILQPGHSTIEIEKEKISSTNSSNVLKAATELLNFKK